METTHKTWIEEASVRQMRLRERGVLESSFLSVLTGECRINQIYYGRKGHKGKLAILQGATMIRLANAEDVPAILQLIHQNNDHLLERTPAEIELLLPTFWVAEVEGTVVGCCCLEIYSRKIAEVRSLVVREEYRHRGVGRQLVAAAVREATRRSIREILTVTSELEFFGRLNFKPVLNEKYALFWSADDEVTACADPEPPANQQ